MSATQTAHDLSTRAMLCGLSISLYGNRKQNKVVSQSVADDHGMGEKIGRYNNTLLIRSEKGEAPKEYEAIVSVANNARIAHRDMTLPWMDNGLRINTNINFMEWSEMVRGFKAKFNHAKAEFVSAYPRLVQETKRIMDEAAEKANIKEDKLATVQGRQPKIYESMFNAANYLSPDKIANKFAFSEIILPLPEEKDFRVNLASAQVLFIQNRMKEHLSGIVTGATRHLLERLEGIVSKVAGLADPTKRPTSAMGDDIRSICTVARKLNIEQNPELDALATQIENELDVDPMYFATCEGERERTVERAQNIMKTLDRLMAE